MKIVIVGCGRVGAVLAEILDHAGHQVVILDLLTKAFDRLPDDFKGQAIRGDGTDEGALRRAGAVGADVLLALTAGDNRNVMATQLALESLGIPKAMAKVNDPVRAAAYAELGVATICRTTLMVDALQGFLGLAPTGLPSVIAPVAPHHPPGAGVGAASTPAASTHAVPGPAGASVAGPRPAREG